MSLAALPSRHADPGEASFETLYERYYFRVRALAHRRFATCDSDDIAQETMLRLLQCAGRLDPRRDPWPYIATIALNVGRDVLRGAVVSAALNEGGHEVGPAAPAADEPVLEQESLRWVQLVLGNLSPRAREVLNLKALDQLSIGEIASTLEMSENAVRQTLFRARRQCRAVLSRLGAVVGAAVTGAALVLRRTRPRHALNAAMQPSMLLAVAAGAALVVAVGTQAQWQHGAAAMPAAKRVSASATVSTLAALDRHGSKVRQGPLVALTSHSPTVSAQIDRPGNLFRSGRTNREHASVLTPLGELVVDNGGRREGGRGGYVCNQLITSCSAARGIVDQLQGIPTH